MLRSSTFFRTLSMVALPIIIQNVIINFLNMIDVVMIGQLGEVEVAAVGLANQVTFVLTLILFGICSGAAIMSAQYWGRKELDGIHCVVGIGLTIGLTGAGIFAIAVLSAPRGFLRLYTPDPAVITIGSSYLRMIAPTYLAMAVTILFSNNLRSVGHVRLPMVVSGSALTLKTVLNYLLIFGNLGFPAMGVQGAALATLIARLLECVVLVFLVYWRNTPLAAHPRAFFNFNRAFFWSYIKVSFPLIVNEIFWSLGITTYSAIYARISTDSIAAINILLTIEQLAFVIFAGVGVGTGILVGNLIGENREDEAYRFVRRAILLNLIGSVFIGGGMVAASGSIVTWYNISEVTRNLALTLIRISGLVLWIKASYIVVMIGAIRAGGDTRFGMIADVVTLWGVGIPMAVLAAFVFHLPVYWVYLMIVSEELVKLGLFLWRFFSKKWINNLTNVSTGGVLSQLKP